MSAPKKAAAKKAASRPASQKADVAPEGAVVTTVGDALEAASVSEVDLGGEQQPLTDAGDGPAAAPGSEATLPSEQQPLTQPETETGLIDPQAGDTPPGDSNQPTDADSPPPPPDQEGEGEVKMPLARVPDAGVIAEAAAYVTAPAESGDAMATGYFLPAPPDVRGHSKKRR